MGTFFFTSGDGTRIRGWRNGGTGPTVVMVPGLGTIPQAFPGLVDPDCGFDVVSFYQRGTFGSEKPADDVAIGVQHHAEDVEALMDTLGIDRAILVAWSLGVNSAFDFTVNNPDRVRALLAIGGVPGGTFDTMLSSLPVPATLRKLTSHSLVNALHVASPVLTEVSRRVPVNQMTARLVSRSGFMMPGSDPTHLTELLEEFLRSDWRWFFTLAKAAAGHEAMDVAHLPMPITFIAATQDALTSRDAIQETANHIPHARVRVVEGSHFIGLENRDAVLTELVNLTARAQEHEERTRTDGSFAGGAAS
jgi:pimeloyl-ACP methyl ester carboxylesterase